MSLLNNISIRSKLIFMQIITALIAVLICSTFFVINDIKHFRVAAIDNKYTMAELIGVNSVSALLFQDNEATKTILANLSSNRTILNVTILDKTGIEFARYNKAGAENYTFPDTQGWGEKHYAIQGDEFVIKYKIIADNEFLGTVVMHAELYFLREAITNHLQAVLIVFLISLAAALFISILLQRVIADRLLLLVSKTRTVSETGDYSTRVPAEGKDEITTLSREYNNMLVQIQNMQDVLKGTNVELEKRVKARTVELETANKKLLATSEDLIQSNTELEQFAYVASHDLQEPLRTIANFTGLVNKKYSGKLDADADKYLGFITKATLKMQNLIKDLLKFSLIGSNMELSEVDCNQVLESVKDDIASTIEEAHAEITSGVLPVLTGNSIELKRLFQNLIINAIKFRKNDTVPHIHITAKETQSDFHFSFKDNGIGIEEQHQERIFIIFQRLHAVAEYPGTGIGLATCKKIVALHNGKITVESKVGEGCTFHFTISKTISNDKL